MPSKKLHVPGPSSFWVLGHCLSGRQYISFSNLTYLLWAGITIPAHWSPQHHVSGLNGKPRKTWNDMFRFPIPIPVPHQPHCPSWKDWWWFSCSVVSDSCDPVDCSLPGSSAHGILQAKILQWVAISFSRGSSWPRDWTQVSCTAGRFFTNWAMREGLDSSYLPPSRVLLCDGLTPAHLLF